MKLKGSSNGGGSLQEGYPKEVLEMEKKLMKIFSQMSGWEVEMQEQKGRRRMGKPSMAELSLSLGCAGNE